MFLPYCVYILISLKDKKLYIGFTTDIKRRFNEHNSGKSRSTSTRRPLQLIFCEYYHSKTDALRREEYFNTNKGKRALKLMLQDSLQKFEHVSLFPKLVPDNKQ